MSQLLDPVVLLLGAVIVFFTGIFVGVVWENRASVFEKLSTKKGLLEEETTPLGLIFLFVILFCALCWLLWDNLKSFCLWLWNSQRGMALCSVLLAGPFALVAEYSGSALVLILFLIAFGAMGRALYLLWKFPEEIELPDMTSRGWEKKMKSPTDTDSFKPK